MQIFNDIRIILYLKSKNLTIYYHIHYSTNNLTLLISAVYKVSVHKVPFSVTLVRKLLIYDE